MISVDEIPYQRHFYPRSPCGERLKWLRTAGIEDDISIHALLAESDFLSYMPMAALRYFYPRSPCGERPLSGSSRATVLVFLSTLSLRRATVLAVRLMYNLLFLSTLSLRRATAL